MFIKVCGIQTTEQIDWALALGYSAVGLVLHRPSVRYCPPAAARELSDYARGRIFIVAVGLEYHEVAELDDAVDFIQVYHPHHPGSRLILAGAERPTTTEFAYFMYDASRGSGRLSQFPPWLGAIRDRLIVSGGLSSDTVASIVRRFQPFGVDVSSGVESSPGVKDRNLMENFITEVMHVDE